LAGDRVHGYLLSTVACYLAPVLIIGALSPARFNRHPLIFIDGAVAERRPPDLVKE
jgi:hypothetical protein